MKKSPSRRARMSMRERVARCSGGSSTNSKSREEAGWVGLGCTWGGVRVRIREVKVRIAERGVVMGTVVGRVKNVERRRRRRRARSARIEGASEVGGARLSVLWEDSGVREGSSRIGEKSVVRLMCRSERVLWSMWAHSAEIAFAVLFRSPLEGSAPREEGVAQRWRLIRISRERDSTSSVRLYDGKLRIARRMLWVRLTNGRKVVA